MARVIVNCSKLESINGKDVDDLINSAEKAIAVIEKETHAYVELELTIRPPAHSLIRPSMDAQLTLRDPQNMGRARPLDYRKFFIEEFDASVVYATILRRTENPPLRTSYTPFRLPHMPI